MTTLTEFLILASSTFLGVIGWYFAIKLSFKTHEYSNNNKQTKIKTVSTIWANYIATLEKDKEDIIVAMENIGMELVDVDVEGNGWGNKVRYNLSFKKKDTV